MKNHINRFNPVTSLCACLKHQPRFQTLYVVVCFIFNDLRDDIGGILYHLCLNFLFIIVEGDQYLAKTPI
jgi:hypothetical protein